MEVVTAPPLIPNKYDIIPIHGSDIASYQRCRRYWDWSSPSRHNLRRKVTIYGINVPLWFGTGIHYSLEMYYNPVIQRDPVEAFSTWFEYQWNGGIVTEEWLDRTYDNEPVPQEDDKWRIQGLRDLLPDPVDTEFAELRELGIGMMEYYRDYAQRHDDFRVIAAESVFSIPLGFEAIDQREESPNYGKKLEAHARGKRDAIIQSLESEHYAVWDHKTKTKFDEDYYLESLEMDPQCTTYMWASQEEARIYDLPYTKIEKTVYQALRKKFPKSPTMTTRGIPSLNRQEEGTTAEMFAQFIKDNNLMVWFEDNEKAQSYYTWLVETAETQYIRRTDVWRNPTELANQGLQIKQVAQEMLSDPSIYPTPSSDFRCIGCQFRPPCLAKNDGSDYEFMLKDGYEPNKDR